MARIEPVPTEKASWLTRLLLRAARRETRKRLGEPIEGYSLVAHHGGVLAGNMFYMASLDRWRRVPRRLKRLVHLRVSMRVGCPA